MANKRQKAGKMNQVISEPVTATGKGRELIPVLIVLLLSFLSFLPALQNHSFVWDDEAYILNNRALQSFDLAEIVSGFLMGNYHPVTYLTLAGEYQLFGLNPAGYHAVSLLLHLVNVVLSFYVVLRLGKSVVVALVASLLFGIHPLHVESVAWITGQKDLLFTLFFLASLLAYLKLAEKQNLKLYLISFSLFLLSMLSKAIAAPLPVVLLLIDYFQGRRFSRRILAEKVPFFLVAILLGIIAVMAQKSSGAVLESSFTLVQRIAFASYGFISYLVKMAFPINLSAFYPYPVKTGNAIPAFYYLYIPVVAALVYLIFLTARFSKKVLLGFGFFSITLFLVLQLYPVGSALMADRYSYLPSLGIFYIAGEGLVSLWKRKQKIIPMGLLVVFALFFSIKTYSRSTVWENNLTLWNDVIAQHRNVPLAYLNRGAELAKAKKTDEAIVDFDQAIRLNPKYNKAYYNRGVAYQEKGMPEQSIEDLTKAIELNPNYIQAYFKRGSAYMDLKQDDKALNDFNKVIGIDRNNAKAFNNRGNVYGNLGKYDLAEKDFSRSIELDPSDAEAYYNRALLYLNLQKPDLALSDFTRVLELNPDDTEAYLNRGNIYSGMGRYKEAINDYTQVIKLKPGDANAYYNRGLAAYLSGNKEMALSDLSQAITMGNKSAKDLLSKIINRSKEVQPF